jgi:hypothetical protein
MQLSEAVREIIRLGTASREYWDRELPKRHPHYPVIRAGEGSTPPPPEDAQIQTILKGLRDDQIYALVLLLYLGRGDFSADHLHAAFETAKDAFPSKEIAIAQLSEEKTLAEYLEDAMQEIQKRHIDVDSPDFSTSVTAG